MGFYRFILNQLRKFAIPVGKSVYKAYKETTSKFSQNKADGKKHPFDQYFSSILSKATNINTPLLTESVALKILNIEAESVQKVEPKLILERYYVLFKKNDPKFGGTAYLQSKVYAAKQCLMDRLPNKVQLEQSFYKQFVEPEILKQQADQKAKQNPKQKIQENKQEKK